MPELPEVEALALDLKGRLAGRAIASVDIAAFSALKTFDPPLQALEGTLVDDVTRHGKFLDIDASGLHLVMHLARGGWVRWRDELPPVPPRPNQKSASRRASSSTTSPASTSPRRAPRSGSPCTSSATRSTSPASPASAPTRSTTRSPSTCSSGILQKAGRAQIKGVLRHQGTIAGHRQRLLRRAAARREDVAVQAGQQPRPTTELQTLYDAIRNVLGDAVERSRGLAASELKGEKKTHLAVHGRTGEKCPVCGDTVREVSFADSSLQYCPTCQTGGKPLADRRMSRLLK